MESLQESGLKISFLKGSILSLWEKRKTMKSGRPMVKFWLHQLLDMCDLEQAIFYPRTIIIVLLN